jgi:hypothetical protein
MILQIVGRTTLNLATLNGALGGTHGASSAFTMRSRRLGWLVFAVGTLLMACGGSDGGSAAADSPEVKAAKIPEDVKKLIDKLDENCAANGTGEGGVSAFDPAKFDAAKIMEGIKAADKEKSGVDCSKERQYSTSREDGVKLFQAHLADASEDTKECVATNLSADERKKLDDLVNDPTNLGVFSNVHAGGDNPEACTYYEFHVFRKDGVRIDIVFNFTD